MSTPIPFTITPEAEKRLSLVAEVPNVEPGIVFTCRYEVHKNGALTEEFNEEHYSVGFDSPEIWISVRSGVRVTIGRRDFWLPPDTLDRLRGKILTAVPREVGRGKYAGKIRDILVAV